MNKHLENVKKWSEVFGCLISPAPKVDIPQSQKEIRIKLLLEEVNELKEALENNDLIEAADACADIQYVLDGTVLALGLQNYIDDLNEEVNRSNWTKIDKETGKPVIREDGKILKPANFEPPRIEEILFPKLEKDKIYRFKDGDFSNTDFKFERINEDGNYKFNSTNVLFGKKQTDYVWVGITLNKNELWKVYEYKQS